ncbi:MAG: hypothetical protein WB493_09615 [Anaeromyxobacteraceae bacterium]
MTSEQMRDLDPRARRAWPGLPNVLPAGAWIVTTDGELRVEADGTVTPRPTPIPWTRPSVAADPCTGSRRAD